MKQTQGYIIPLALMITSVSVVLVTSIFYSSITHYAFARRFVERQQAAVLARSGIEVAVAQLTAFEKQAEQKQKDQKQQEQVKKEGQADQAAAGEKQEQVSPKKARLAKLLGTVNRWQTFTFTEGREGLDGTLKVYIAAERGKLNLNKLYNFKEHTFIKQNQFDAAALMKWLFPAVQRFTGGKDLYSGLSTWLKARRSQLNELTELLADKQLSSLNAFVFLEPTDKKDDKKQIYLTDLFTIDSDKLTIDPLFFSQSMARVLGLKREPIKNINAFIKNLPEQLEWQTAWDKVLAPVYGKEYRALPDTLKPLLNSQFEPIVFSVVSYATVGETTQKMYAIVHKDRTTTSYSIKKLYWL